MWPLEAGPASRFPPEAGPRGQCLTFSTCSAGRERRSSAVAVRDRHAAVAAERAAGDLDAGRGLTALVLGAQDELLAAEVLLDVGVEDRVEHGVGGERVLVALIGPQLGARRALDDRARDQIRARGFVHVARQLVDDGLRAVLDDREAAGEVAVEGRVADRHLRLV